VTYQSALEVQRIGCALPQLWIISFTETVGNITDGGLDREFHIFPLSFDKTLYPINELTILQEQQMCSEDIRRSRTKL